MEVYIPSLWGAIDSSSYISFYSKENLTLGGEFNSIVPNHNSGYATNHDVWPSISFELQDNLKVKNELLPKAFALHQNFPNPFNPVTTIHFDLPKESNIKLSVYDILGRSIKELVNEKQSPGFKSIKWDATNNFGKEFQLDYTSTPLKQKTSDKPKKCYF